VYLIPRCGRYYCRGYVVLCDNSNTNSWIEESCTAACPRIAATRTYWALGAVGRICAPLRMSALSKFPRPDEKLLFISDAIPTGYMGQSLRYSTRRYCSRSGVVLSDNLMISAYMMGAGARDCIDRFRNACRWQRKEQSGSYQLRRS